MDAMDAVDVCSGCVKWSKKYSKVEAGRTALRRTVAILQKRVDELIQLNATLSKDVQELRSQADKEREARTKEDDTRVALEKEIAELKLEFPMLQQSRPTQTPDTDQQVTRVSDLENEIQKLNKLLDEEKSRADAAFKNAQVEKTKAAEAQEAAKLEKNRAGREKSRAATEAKRAQEFKVQLDALKNEAAVSRSQLTLAISKSEEANRRLEAERKKASEEQKRAHLMSSEAEKLKKLVGAYEKKLADEKHHADILSCQMDEERIKNEEMLKTIDELQNKINSLEASSKLIMVGNNSPDDKGVNAGNLTSNVKTRKAKASKRKRNADSEIAEVLGQTLIQTDTIKSVEEKRQGDKLTHALEGIRETVEAYTHANQVIAHTQVESIVDPRPEKVSCVPLRENGCDGHELKLSKEQIKIAKTQAKRIVKNFRKSSLKKTLDILKHGFLQFSNTLEFLDRTLSGEGKDATVLVEAQHCSCLRWKEQKFLDIKRLQLERERENPLCVLHLPSNIACNPSKQALLPPDSGINIAESTSFTESNTKLERPAGGSYKDLYVSSAKNSSGASFSDCWSMNSQGKFNSSTTSPNLADGSSLQMTDSRLCGDVTELMCNDMPTLVSNTVAGRLGPVRSKKRKRILSVLESVQCGLSDSKKIQMQMEENISTLRAELQNQMAAPAETNSVACNNQYDRFDKSCKKKEGFHKQKINSQCLAKGAHTVELDNENTELDGVTADLGIDALAIVPANNLLNGAKVCKSTNVASSKENSYNPSECVGQITDGDYMVLLDLDDHDYERRYRVARENVLSPSLPEINFHGRNVYSVDGADHKIKDSSNAGFPGPNCITHVDDSLNLKEHDVWTACKPMVREDAADCFSVKDINHDSRDVQVEGSSLKVHVRMETGSPCETLFSDDFANLCVVHSETIDRDNLCKVFDATRKGASHCHLSSPPGVLLKRVLDYIESNNVPPKEKACVFFSIILAGNHGAAARKLSHPISESDVIPNSYMADIFSAINDVDVKNCLAQTISLHELLNFIAEFLKEGKLWVCCTPDRNLSESDDSSVSVLVDNMKLFLQAASTEQLVFASTILASLCVSFDEIDFIVFLSYDLFRLRKYSNTVALSVIHGFAQLAGRKFLTSTSNSLLAGVVNSLVYLHESPQSPSKNSCSEEVASLDTVISLLLERLQSLMEMGITNILHEDSQEEISDQGVSDTVSSSSLEETFAQFTDVLSLVELIANTVSWDILSGKVVPQLLMKLESSAVSIFSVAIIIVLGQFGRLGVTANGPEDTWVTSIRCQLNGILGIDSSKNMMHPIQVASVCSLLKFVNLDPNSLLSSAGMEAPVDKASPACEIRRWFTSLSKEQQTIFMGILKEAPPV